MNFHHLANLFPLLEGREFDDLVADVAANGVHEPIWTLDGSILDGRNRWRAAQSAGVECPSREYEGDDPVGFVLSLNLHRRHLNESQRAMVAAKLATMPVGRPSEKSPIGEITQQAAAEMLNVGKRSVERAREVLDDGPEEVIAAVERGEMAVSLAARVTELPPDELEQVVHAPPEQMSDIARAVTKAHVANNSGNNEWYTPPEYIDMARQVMGGIDTDPASSKKANETVGADVFFSSVEDGLGRSWNGRVWMNPPYSQPLISDFCDAVANKFESGEISQACVLVNNATETAWFQRVLNASSAVCFPRGRIRFIDMNGEPSGAPLQGQAVLYLGPNAEDFCRVFSAKGTVLRHA